MLGAHPSLGIVRDGCICEFEIGIIPMSHEHAFSAAENKLFAPLACYLRVKRLSECEGHQGSLKLILQTTIPRYW